MMRDHLRIAKKSKAAGERAETRALEFLQDQGLQCVDRNVRCRLGEIDLVMQKQKLLIIVEVRYRKAGSLLSAIETVDARKQRKLTLAAAWYLSRRPEFRAFPVRFDVIAIDGRSNDESAIQWITDAFRPGE